MALHAAKWGTICDTIEQECHAMLSGLVDPGSLKHEDSSKEYATSQHKQRHLYRF